MVCLEQLWGVFEESAGQRPEWLRVERVLGEGGVRKDNGAGRRQFKAGMEARREQEMREETPEWKPLRRGWCWGPEEFR